MSNPTYPARKKTITPCVVETVIRLSESKQYSYRQIAEVTCVSEYVVKVILTQASMEEPDQSKTIPKMETRSEKCYLRVDENLVQHIRRMVKQGYRMQIICRDLLVSETTVRRVMRGDDIAPSCSPLTLMQYETWHRVPVRCLECGHSVEVTPCRYCRTKKNKLIRECLEKIL